MEMNGPGGCQNSSGGFLSPKSYGNFSQTQSTRIPNYEIKWDELKRAFSFVTVMPDNSVSTPVSLESLIAVNRGPSKGIEQ